MFFYRRKIHIDVNYKIIVNKNHSQFNKQKMRFVDFCIIDNHLYKYEHKKATNRWLIDTVNIK